MVIIISLCFNNQNLNINDVKMSLSFKMLNIMDTNIYWCTVLYIMNEWYI